MTCKPWVHEVLTAFFVPYPILQEDGWRYDMRWAMIFAVLVFLGGVAYGAEREIALTVYNQNLGLVREIREMTLEKGANRVEFVDVASGIDPTSVHFRALTAPDAVSILEQNYEYDLIGSTKLMGKYLGRRIGVFAKEQRVHEGRLLSFAQGDIVLEPDGGGIEIVKPDVVEYVQFPSLPEGLVTRPTLVWLLESEKAGRHRVEVSYLTSGIDWHAEYVAVSRKEDTELLLAGWVSIDNRSGATYEDAKVKLVAGDIHRVYPVRPVPEARGYELAMAKRSAPQFEEKAFFEYHLYTLGRRTLVKDNQIKQISLFPGTKVRTKKVYGYDGARQGDEVKVKLTFRNSASDGLGMPLPEGIVRLYKEDEDGAPEFVGEDRIEHTPRDEKVEVTAGNAFDLVGERKVTEHRRIGDKVYEETVEIELRNHKESPVEIMVTEHMRGTWEILKKSHDFEKKDAYTAEFKVPVEKDGETKIRYTVRVMEGEVRVRVLR